MCSRYEHHTVYYGVASVLFYLPVLREVLLLMGCREITKETALKLLVDTPYSLAMIPGGIAEQIRSPVLCHGARSLG